MVKDIITKTILAYIVFATWLPSESLNQHLFPNPHSYILKDFQLNPLDWLRY